MFKKILLYFFFWRILTYFFAYVATFIIPLQIKYTAIAGPYILWVWTNFDGIHYINIAKNGYSNFEQAFLPFYPMVIKLTHFVLNLYFPISYLISGQLVSIVFFIFSLWMIEKLLRLDKFSNLTNLIFLIIIFYPTSFFYGAVYTDSIFLFLATSSIYFARKKNWILSSLSGGFAIVTRFNGIALMFMIIAEYISEANRINKMWDLKTIASSIKLNFRFKLIKKNKIFSVILIPLFIGLYFCYVQFSEGSWKMIVSSVAIWDQNKITLPLQVFWRYSKIMFINSTFQLTYWVAFFELMALIFYFSVIVYSFKKIRLSYWIFLVVSILIPSLTGTFQGMPRYGLHLYPMYLVLGIFLNKSSIFVKCIYFIISVSLMFLFLGLYTRGYFIS